MTELPHDNDKNINDQSFQKASDAALRALNSVAPNKDMSGSEEPNETPAEVNEATNAAPVSAENNTPVEHGSVEEAKVDNSEEKAAFVSPHMYETPQAAEPASVPSIPQREFVYTTPAPVAEVSHTHKPWFYVLTGGLAGLLVGAACVAGCTSLALHTGYGDKVVESTSSTQSQEVPRGNDGSTDGQDSRGYDNRGYGHNHGYDNERGYNDNYYYLNPYGHNYGYGQNPYGYGYGYDYGYPYGYNYGYTNPYGYDYGYTIPYGYSNPYEYSYPYTYDLEDLLDLYGYGDQQDKGNAQKDSDTSKDESRNESKNTESESGILDLSELFGGQENSVEEPPLTMDELMEIFDVPMGDTSGSSYGTGVYVVGKDGIDPGLYYVEGTPGKENNFYLYEDEDSKGGVTTYEIEAGVAYVGNYFVELEKGDVLVYKPADESNRFYSAAEAPKVGDSPYESGLYRVGTDIPAGTYKITASSEKVENASQDCAAYVMKDLDFDDDSMLESKFVMPGGTQTIEVEDGQWLELYGACAELQK